MKGPSFCMTQNNARRLSPRLAAKHSFLFKKEKSSRKENLQMTTLSRQGVEPVCKGKRQADRVPLAGGGPGGPGPGRWAEHGPGGGVRGRAGPERRRLPKGGQAAALWTPAPPPPTADDHTSRACAPGFGSRGGLPACPGWSLPLPPALPPGQQRRWERDLVCLHVTPSCRGTSVLPARAPAVRWSVM